MPAKECAIRSRALCNRVIEILSPRLSEGSLFAAYVTLGSELDTAVLLHEAYKQKWRVCLPCMLNIPALPDAPSLRMAFVEVAQDILDGHEAPFLIKPAQGVSPNHPSLAGLSFVEPAQLDAIVVPLVAFDASNNRLGYGKGNYDRFLAQVRDDAIVMGVAFAEQQVDAIPLEAHDKPLSHIEIA